MISERPGHRTRWRHSASPSCHSCFLQLCFLSSLGLFIWWGSRDSWLWRWAGERRREALNTGRRRSLAKPRCSTFRKGRRKPRIWDSVRSEVAAVCGRCRDQSKRVFTGLINLGCMLHPWSMSYCLVEHNVTRFAQPRHGPSQWKHAAHRTRISSFMHVFCMQRMWTYSEHLKADIDVYIPDGNQFACWGQSEINSLLCHGIFETRQERNTFTSAFLFPMEWNTAWSQARLVEKVKVNLPNWHRFLRAASCCWMKTRCVGSVGRNISHQVTDLRITWVFLMDYRFVSLTFWPKDAQGPGCLWSLRLATLQRS